MLFNQCKAFAQWGTHLSPPKTHTPIEREKISIYIDMSDKVLIIKIIKEHI